MSKFKKPNGDFQSAAVKQLARAFLYREIENKFDGSHFKPHIFTMPGDALSLEADLAVTYGRRMWLEGVERDAAVFKSAKRKLKRDGIKMVLHNQDADDFWKNTKNVFDFAWLDYCGPWCPSNQRVFR